MSHTPTSVHKLRIVSFDDKVRDDNLEINRDLADHSYVKRDVVRRLLRPPIKRPNNYDKAPKAKARDVIFISSRSDSLSSKHKYFYKPKTKLGFNRISAVENYTQRCKRVRSSSTLKDAASILSNHSLFRRQMETMNEFCKTNINKANHKKNKRVNVLFVRENKQNKSPIVSSNKLRTKFSNRNVPTKLTVLKFPSRRNIKRSSSQTKWKRRLHRSYSDIFGFRKRKNLHHHWVFRHSSAVTLKKKQTDNDSVPNVATFRIVKFTSPKSEPTASKKFCTSITSLFSKLNKKCSKGVCTEKCNAYEVNEKSLSPARGFRYYIAIILRYILLIFTVIAWLPFMIIFGVCWLLTKQVKSRSKRKKRSLNLCPGYIFNSFLDGLLWVSQKIKHVFNHTLLIFNESSSIECRGNHPNPHNIYRLYCKNRKNWVIKPIHVAQFDSKGKLCKEHFNIRSHSRDTELPELRISVSPNKEIERNKTKIDKTKCECKDLLSDKGTKEGTGRGSSYSSLVKDESDQLQSKQNDFRIRTSPINIIKRNKVKIDKVKCECKNILPNIIKNEGAWKENSGVSKDGSDKLQNKLKSNDKVKRNKMKIKTVKCECKNFLSDKSKIEGSGRQDEYDELQSKQNPIDQIKRNKTKIGTVKCECKNLLSDKSKIEGARRQDECDKLQSKQNSIYKTKRNKMTTDKVKCECKIMLHNRSKNDWVGKESNCSCVCKEESDKLQIKENSIFKLKGNKMKIGKAKCECKIMLPNKDKNEGAGTESDSLQSKQKKKNKYQKTVTPTMSQDISIQKNRQELKELEATGKITRQELQDTEKRMKTEFELKLKKLKQELVIMGTRGKILQKELKERKSIEVAKEKRKKEKDKLKELHMKLKQKILKKKLAGFKNNFKNRLSKVNKKIIEPFKLILPEYQCITKAFIEADADLWQGSFLSDNIPPLSCQPVPPSRMKPKLWLFDKCKDSCQGQKFSWLKLCRMLGTFSLLLSTAFIWMPIFGCFCLCYKILK